VLTPFVKRAQLTEENARKYPESVWKFLFYVYTSSLCFYMIGTKYPFLSRPESVWEGWHEGVDVPLDIYVIYITQMGFYLHSFYATAYMDDIRKDYLLMYVHHTVSCLLIGFSLAVRYDHMRGRVLDYCTACVWYRYYNIGVLLFTLHDINDVIMEFCKCMIYLKTQRGKEYPMFEKLANSGFVVFIVTW
jgi:ceramide synthetase